jgi:hypothetical protein
MLGTCHQLEIAAVLVRKYASMSSTAHRIDGIQQGLVAGVDGDRDALLDTSIATHADHHRFLACRQHQPSQIWTLAGYPCMHRKSKIVSISLDVVLCWYTVLLIWYTVMQETSFGVPDEEMPDDEASIQEAVSASDRLRSSNAACHLSKSPSRKAPNLHSSVLVTFNESDLDSYIEDHHSDADTVSVGSPPRHLSSSGPQPTEATDSPFQWVAASTLPACKSRSTGPRCISRSDSGKHSLNMAKGSSLHEQKSSPTAKKATRFAHSGDSSAGEDSKKTGEDVLRLPKLETSKQRAASTGGGLSVGVGGSHVQGASTSGGLPDVNKLSNTLTPNSRRAHTFSASSPGDISSEAFESRAISQKAPTQGIPALRSMQLS